VSNDLYRTALYFDGRRGAAKSEGVTVELTECPAIPPLPQKMVEVSFYPQVRDYRLRESAGPMRAMHAPEIEAVLKFLGRLAAFGKSFRAKKSLGD